MNRGVAEVMGAMVRDARYGLRRLAGTPGFTLAAATCLGIGIGVAVAIYAYGQATIFKDTPGVSAPRQLVSFQTPVSFPDFAEYRDHGGQFESATAFLAPVPFVLSTGGQPERLWGHLVTPNYFQVLGVAAAAGRLFGAEEERPGSTSAVISYRLWQSRFGGRPDLVGSTVRVNGQSAVVVGVAGPGFAGATPLLAMADLWLATTAPARIAPELGGSILEDRGIRTFQVIGRLKPGVTASGAETALDALARRLELVHADPDRDRGGRRITLLPGGRVFPIRDQDLPFVVSFPAAIVGLILLMACGNVATMLVARGASRQREIAIRFSLGAGRAQVVRQLLAESGLLALLGGAAGLLFAYAAFPVLRRFVAFLPNQMHFELRMGWPVYLAALVVTGASALLFGLVPALQATRGGIVQSLKGGAPSGLRVYRWLSLRNLLVVQQMAASLTLLVLTAFVVLAVQRSKAIKLGFESGNLFLVSIDPVRDGMSPAQATDFFQRLPERVRRIAGVRSAALAQSAPFGLDSGEAMMAAKSEFAHGPELSQRIGSERVGCGFFETLGVPVLAGRTFREADQRDGSRVAVVNASMAEQTWPGRAAVGQTLELDDATYEVVGVVGDIGAGFTLGRRHPCVYRPDVPAGYASPSAQGVMLVVRAERGVDVPLLVRRELGAISPDLTMFNVSSMTEQVERMESLFRLAMTIYSSLGVFGLALAAVGLSGVTAYAVARRTHEIGIRRALGAQNRDVLWLVLREGFVLIVVGIALGLATTWGVIRLSSATLSAVGELMKVNAGDPLLLGGASLLLAVLALAACYLPARRSLRVNPVEALRAE